MNTLINDPLPYFSFNSHQNLYNPTAQCIHLVTRLAFFKKKRINAYLSYLCQNSFISTITWTVKPDILLITSHTFAYYSNISFYEMGTFPHTAMLAGAACICTLAWFTQPQKGYLWQLIMPSFMHINESCEQPFSAVYREKKISWNGKWIISRIPE